MVQKNSKQKAAINFVADSKCPKNLKELLDHSNDKLDLDYVYNGETVLNTLVKKLRDKGNKNVAKCIRMLLKNGASPNLPDSEGLTPLENLLNNKLNISQLRLNLISDFVKNPTLDFQLYRKGLEYLLSYSEDFFKNINEPYKILVRNLVDMKKDTLLYTLEQYKKNVHSWNRNAMQRELLSTHLEDPKNTKNALKAVIMMILPDNDANTELVGMAMEAGSWSTVLFLLRDKHIKLLPRITLLLVAICQVQTDELTDYTDYEKCLIALLEDQDKLLLMTDDDAVSVDHAVDDDESTMNTPLHYAVQCRNEIAIRVLLRQGARLGRCNIKGQLPFEDIAVDVLEEHFDHCITSRGKKPSHKDYEIIINLMNLTNENNALDMKPIAYIASKPDLSPLLLHPLITCFLHFKWQRLTKIFTLHFLLFVVFASALIAHVLLRFPTRIDKEWVILIPLSLCFLHMIYMVVVIVFEYWFLNVLSFKLDVTLIVMVTLTCLEIGENDETKRIIAVAAILIMALQLFSLIGTLPLRSVVIHMLILKQVTLTFLRSLAHYFIFPLTFALAFYLIFAKSTDKTLDSSKEFLTFADKPGSVMKMLTVFHGVIENNDFTGYSSSTILLLFMFMTMILTNLLGALAVSDTQVRLYLINRIYYLRGDYFDHFKICTRKFELTLNKMLPYIE